MVAALSLGQVFHVLLQLSPCIEAGAIDSGEHLVALVAAPVRAAHAQKFEMPELAG